MAHRNVCRIFAVLLLLTWLTARQASAQLMAHATVAVGGGMWDYTVFNDEPSTSTQYVKFFNLDLPGAILGVSAPSGWGYDTDLSTFVLWFNEDAALPYPNDIAPGGSLSGFTLTSSVTNSVGGTYGVTSWDHATDTAGLFTAGDTLVPAAIPAVPEPGTVAYLLSLTGAGLAGLRRARVCKA